MFAVGGFHVNPFFVFIAYMSRLILPLYLLRICLVLKMKLPSVYMSGFTVYDQLIWIRSLVLLMQDSPNLVVLLTKDLKIDLHCLLQEASVWILNF